MNPRVDSRERKRIVPCSLKTTVNLDQIGRRITAYVRCAAGYAYLGVDRPSAYRPRSASFKPELVATVDKLLEQHCDREIADILKPGRVANWESSPST